MYREGPVNPVARERQTPDVEDSLNDLGHSLMELNSVADALIDRLNPIITPPTTNQKDIGVPQRAGLTPLGDSISTQAGVARSISYKLSAIIDRLGI